MVCRRPYGTTLREPSTRADVVERPAETRRRRVGGRVVVALARPEEPTQPVAASAGYDVHVQMSHTLTDDVVVRDERALGIEGRRHDPGDRTHPLEEGPDRIEIGQGDDVLHRHDEGVPVEQRAPIEERHGDVVTPHDPGGSAAGDDVAERARVDIHGAAAYVAHAPSALVATTIHHAPTGVLYNRRNIVGSADKPSEVNVTNLISNVQARELPTPHGAAAEEETTTRVVVDTSVLIADPHLVQTIGDIALIIPLTVVEELDSLKTRSDDVGRAARTALRSIEDLRVRHGGSLADPVPVGAGTVQIEVNRIQKHLLVEHGLDIAVPDNRIIGAALGQRGDGPTVMLSNDAALRIKAAHLGVDAAEHQPTKASTLARPVGWSVVDADFTVIDCLYAAQAVDAGAVPEAADIRENEFAVLRSGSQSALTRRVGDELVLLGSATPEPWGLRPRNKEQRFALELLLDPDIAVVALDGRAGTGKTILAIAAALEQVVEQRLYERVAIYRPLVPVGRADVGFLPGGLEEKLDPWMSAIHDAIVALTDHTSSHDARRLIEQLTANGQLSLESVTFLRGRSLQRQIVVIDEAQNLEPTTLRTILTRIGDGTKVVFTGDTSQIDAPYLGETNNALAVLSGAFGGQPCFGHVTLTACERSDVASLAAELL